VSLFRLLLRNLLFHRRGNFAVFLGVALGTAVLTGALLVGDSLRGSLKALALDQLGWVENAMVAPRFFRARLAEEIGVSRTCPALLLRGSTGNKVDGKTKMVNKVNVLGIDDRFWPEGKIPANKDFWTSDAAEVVLNQSLADSLKAVVGDTIALHVQKADDVPREYLLGKRRKEDVVEAIKVKIKDILPDEGMARFTLTPSPEPVRNAFVPLGFLQQKLNLAGKANALLTAGPNSTLSLVGRLRLEDWGLKLLTPVDRAKSLARLLDPRNADGNIRGGRWDGRVPDALENPDKRAVLTIGKVEEFYRQQRNYALLESQTMLLDDALVEAVQTRPFFEVDGELFWKSPLLIYLADSISYGKNEISYAVVAGRGPILHDADPPLGEREIDLAEYGTLGAKPGDVVTLSYFAPDDHNHLQKLHEKFTVRKLFPLKGRYDDADLVPQFPGITDKLDLRDWDQSSLPFPYDSARGKYGEDYWKRYRGTPRAYINLETAQKLWGSRFGKITSFQIMPVNGSSKDFDKNIADIGNRILRALDPAKGGFVWQNVRAQGQKAGGGSTDFGEFFLYFSFFLIVAALLLVGLLFRLNLDLRGREMGILLATGWTFPQVRGLLLMEGYLLAIFGATAGLGGALIYADLLLKYLSREWPGGLLFLKLHVTVTSLAIGWGASVIVSFLTILWAVRVLSRMTPTRLLAGDTTASVSAVDNVTNRKPRRDWSRILIPLCAFAAGGLLATGMIAKGQEAQAGSFFGGGFFVLALGLTLVWRRLRSSASHGNPRQSLAGLAVRNASRHAVRSVLTVGLLSSATFLIVAVQSFHKEAGAEFLEKTGGSGGFLLYAQADVPVFQDLNDPASVPRKREESPTNVKFYPCRLQAGDDASCLNLYQPQNKPRILGVPRSLIERGGFSFGQTLAKSDEERKNPWLLLTSMDSGSEGIPVIVDANSAEYILHKSLGDTYEVTDDRGDPVKLRIAGLLHDSVFQSEIVVSDANFRRLFPRQEGFSFFLIEAPKDDADKIKTAWEDALSENGLTIETTSSRLDQYLAVENTYLATFQALGGLGLLLGAAGLAIVLLRSVWERRGELALLRALGFRRSSLAWLVMVENTFLLLAGLLVGTVSALLAVAPHLIGGRAHVLGLRVAELLGLVIVVGLAAGLAAVFTTLRAPLLPALRNSAA
jgi:ABC-type lipoprotein release transport system permease subunit